MDWTTFSAVVGVVLTTIGVVIGLLHRLRTNDLHHVQLELAHLSKSIEELKDQDRCARKEHDSIRREVSERTAEIYRRIEEHTRWHLEHRGET